MKKTFLFIMLAATDCIHAQVKPLGEGTLDLETFRFDTKITDLYPEENKNDFYPNGNVYNFPGSKDGVFERNQVKNGHHIYADDVQRDVVVYRQIAYNRHEPVARFGEQSFGAVNIMTTPDGRIAAVNASARGTTEDRSAALVAYLTKKYGAPARLKSSWDENGAPIYEWTASDRIIRCAYVEDKSAVLNVDLDRMRITQAREKSYISHVFLIDPQLKGEVFPGGKRCTVPGYFGFMNAETD